MIMGSQSSITPAPRSPDLYLAIVTLVGYSVVTILGLLLSYSFSYSYSYSVVTVLGLLLTYSFSYSYPVRVPTLSFPRSQEKALG